MSRKITLLLALLLLVPLQNGSVAQEGETFGWDILQDANFVDKSGNDPMLGPEFLAGEEELIFGEKVKRFVGVVVELKGFMLPLELGEKQGHFILAQFPMAHCRFCQPGGVKNMVEVRAKTPVSFSYDAVTISGKLELMDEMDPLGLLYRMVEVEPVP
jgi:hypothetical protein